MVDTAFDEKSLLWSGPKISKPNDKSLGEVLLMALKRHSTKVTQISDDNGVHMTSNEIRQKAIRTAKNLTKLGFTKTDVMGFYCKNSHNSASVVFGAVFIGAAINPIDLSIDDKDEVANIFANTKPSIIFVDEDNVETIKYVKLKLQINVKIFVFDKSGDGYCSTDDLFVETDEIEDNFRVTHIDSPDRHDGLILYTSGTTRLQPKCIVHSNAALLNNMDVVDTYADNISLTFSYLGVISGINTLIATTICGMLRIITTEPFSISLFMKLIEKYKVTMIYRPPMHMEMILKDPGIHSANLSTLKQFWSGSSMVYEYLINEMNKHLPNGSVFIKYGVTEVFGGISYHDPKLRSKCLGKLVSGLLVKIVDKSGKRCGINENGEICFKSKYQLLRYHNDDAATRKLIDAEGFIQSGDFGYFDADGFLYMIDRQTDLITTSGDNFVSAVDIENAILQLDGVLHVAVVGVKNCNYKIVPAAAVIKSNIASTTEEEIYNVVKDNLSEEHTLGGGVYFMEAFPVVRQKVKKNELRQIIAELYQQSNTRL